MIPDIFFPEDVTTLLKNKVVFLLGDSNMRAVYKDLITLTQKKCFITKNDLKTKMEESFLGDRLVYHGELFNGRDFKEERKYKSPETNGSYNFFFITKTYNHYVDDILNHAERQKPDLVIINSCLWDITRWGPSGVEQYKKNIRILMRKMRDVLPADCLVIWLTTAPITAQVYGGFLVQQLEFLRYSLRFHVMEANQYAHKVASEVGVDIVDIHYALRTLLHLRADDGIHWQPPAVRHITNSILTHVSLAWEFPLPHRFPSTKDEEQRVTLLPKPTRKPTRKAKKRKQRFQAQEPFGGYDFSQATPINQLSFAPNFTPPVWEGLSNDIAQRHAQFARELMMNDAHSLHANPVHRPPMQQNTSSPWNIGPHNRNNQSFAELEEQFRVSQEAHFSQGSPINQLAFLPNFSASTYNDVYDRNVTASARRVERQVSFGVRTTGFSQEQPINQLMFLPNYGVAQYNPYTHFLQTRQNNTRWMPY